MSQKRWTVTATAVLTLAVVAAIAVACGGSGGEAGDGDLAVAEQSDAADDARDEGPSSLPPVNNSNGQTVADGCGIPDPNAIAVGQSEPPVLEPGDEPFPDGPIEVDVLPNDPATDEDLPAVEILEVDPDDAVTVSSDDAATVSSYECDAGESERDLGDGPDLGEPVTPLDQPIRSDEGIDPDECNLIHNIDACTDEEIAQGFPN